MLGVRPSYATGFAQWPGMSEYPGLWTGLVGAWAPFLGATGNKVYDLSGNGSTGSLVATAHFVPGKFGPTLEFDGDSDYVDLGDASNAELSFPFSITSLINFDQLASTKGANMAVISKYNHNDNQREYRFGILTADDKLFFRKVEDGGTVNREDISNDTAFVGSDVGRWFHVAITADSGGNWVFYVNGLSDGSGTFANTNFFNGTANAFIGADNDGAPAATFFDGKIDIPTIWNRVLSASEIALLYQLRKRLVA